MKKITIIGTGISQDTMTAEAVNAINDAEVLIGAARLTDFYKNSEKRIFNCRLPDESADVIIKVSAKSFAVLVSGDVGFYSAATKLKDLLDMPEYDLRFIAGVSSVNAFFARLQLPWQNAAFVSAHGRETNIADYVRRNRLTFCLTGGNVNEIGMDLAKAGFGQIKIYAGENLGALGERVYETVAEELTNGNYPSLTVLLFVNEQFDDSVHIGIPDGKFLRLGGVPMTKSEIRAIVMSKLCLKPTSVCYDIGAGTGSVTVEMALSAYKGTVYAVERRTEATVLIKQNLTGFHIGNAVAVQGEAPSVLEQLPPPDVAFIGGSGGYLREIITCVLSKNPNVRIVITAVTVETVALALEVFKSLEMKTNITQINVSRGELTGKSHLMKAQNPVTIISAGGLL